MSADSATNPTSDPTLRPEAALEERRASLLGQLLQRESAFRKYCRIVVGKVGFWPFVRFEFLTGLCAGRGGAWGIALRRFFYKRLLGRMGRNVVIGRHVTLRHPHKIQLGDNVFIDDYAVLDAKGDQNQGIAIGNHCFVGRNTVLSCKEGDIHLDDYVSISNNCSLLSETRIRIGTYAYIAGHCYLVAGGNHKYDRVDVPIMLQDADDRGGIVLEGDNWLGAGVQVLDGVTIGRGSVIGAGSTVYKNIEGFSIAVGVPAMVTKRRR